MQKNIYKLYNTIVGKAVSFINGLHANLSTSMSCSNYDVSAHKIFNEIDMF